MGFDSSREKLVRKLAEHAFLALDDISGTAMTEHWIMLLHRVLTQRMQYSRPTLLTSKTAPRDLYPLVGGDVASRLGGFCWHAILGRDKRALLK